MRNLYSFFFFFSFSSCNELVYWVHFLFLKIRFHFFIAIWAQRKFEPKKYPTTKQSNIYAHKVDVVVTESNCTLLNIDIFMLNFIVIVIITAFDSIM